YLEALALDPNDQESFECFTRLARAFAQVGRFAAVPKVFDRAKEKLDTSKDGARSYALYAWGGRLLSFKLVDEAVEAFRQSAELANDAISYANLGSALRARGRPEQAIEQLQKAHEMLDEGGSKIRKFPLSIWAYALLDLERSDEAVERAKQAI